MHEAGAMYRADWSPKPNAHAYENLALGEWWTNAHTLTDDSGRATVPAFLGDYTIEVKAQDLTHARRSWKHQHDARPLTIVLPLASQRP
jgi:endo-1,4-beta-xylanase